MSSQRWTYREEEAYGPIADVEEILSNKEKRHYSRALKEMHELVKLESLRMHTSISDSESETESQLYDDDINDAYFSGLFINKNSFALSVSKKIVCQPSLKACHRATNQCFTLHSCHHFQII